VIQALVGWSVRHRVLVVLSTLVLAAAGVFVGAHLKFDALPDVTNNQVLVLTRAAGLTPEEVERLVTRPVEAALGGLPGLVEQRSLSRYGISSVTAVFEDGVNPYLARQIVQERLNGVTGGLPAGVSPPELGPMTGGLGEIFHFTLDSPRRSPSELLEIATFKVSPLLRSVPGIVEVNTWGGEERVLEVKADPVRLAARGLSLDDLREALEKATGTAPGASLPAGSAQTLLRAVALPRDAADLGYALVVPRGGGSPVRLADVAEVSVNARTRIGAATENGKGETVYVMAQMLRGENALEVMRRLKKQLVEVRRVLPEDVYVDVVYDRSQLVLGTLRTVFQNLLEGGLLVVAVLFLMLGSFRAGLLVASAIPLSMLGATAAMVALDIPGNLMSLGALDFGLIVDGSVVLVEAVFHGVHRGEVPSDPRRARVWWVRHVEKVATSVAQPVFFSVLIILLVYVPVLSLAGVDGKMFRPMALTVVFALAASLVLSLTFVPAATALFLRPRDVPQKPPLLVRGIERLYRPFLAATVARPWAVAAGSVVLLVTGGLLFASAGSEFVPQLDEGDLVVQTTRPADISLESAVREGGRLEAAMIEKVPEVKEVVSRIGSPAVATDIMGLEQSDVFVLLRPREKWREGKTKAQIIADIDRAAKGTGAVADVSFTQPIQMRFNELLGGSVADVTLSIYGDDLAELEKRGEESVKVIARVPGAEDARVFSSPAVSLLEVRPRPLDASRAGFTVRSLLDAVQALRTGIEVGATYEGPLRVPILLRLGGTPSAFTLADLSVPAPTGGLVPLSRVADVHLTTSPSLVSRQNAERRIVVGFNVRGADLGTVVASAEKAVGQQVKLPRGYRIEWGGQYETLAAAKRRLAVVIPVVMLMIVGVLLFAFRRLKPALLIFLNVPFASVGGMMALWSRGMPVSISAAVGFIALSGIAVLNGVVLMSRILQLEEAGESPRTAAADAARERARPVLMTALVAALGFVPMMLATGVGAEVQRPLATVVVGGLVTSTVLTLLVLPALYPWLSRLGPKEEKDEPVPEAVG